MKLILIILQLNRQRNYSKQVAFFRSCIILLGLFLFPFTAMAKVNHVFLISLDGLRPDAISKNLNDLPHFRRLLEEGTATFNARTDVDFTVTLPNHTSMITGRSVLGNDGHGITFNDVSEATIHQVKGKYVSSVFDVLHQKGLVSAMFASKRKFKIFADSYPIDIVQIHDLQDELTLINLLKVARSASKPNFFFIHFSRTDVIGHQKGWSVNPWSDYMKAVKELDHRVGLIMEVIERMNKEHDSAVLILTTDHGGRGRLHDQNQEVLNYTIPMMIWGEGIKAGQDLYVLNKNNRLDPLREQVPYGKAMQPIRNGDAANLALHLLGLDAILDSNIGLKDPLVVQSSEEK